MIALHDRVLPDVHAYRAAALASAFKTVNLGQVFHGIAQPPSDAFEAWFTEAYPDHEIVLTFLRQSPAGQVEPNDIHNDVDMGHLTAILYLNPEAPAGDGTTFWRQRYTDLVGTDEPTAGVVGQDRAQWHRELTAPARYNRAVVFSAELFHSRAIAENYGEGESARLIQVLFARRKADI